MTSRSSPIRRARRPSGTRSSCPTRPPPGAWAGTRTCWSGRWRTRGVGGRYWPRRRTSHTWSRRWTRWCASWAGSPGSGGSTGWPRSAHRRRAGSRRRSPRSPSTTASGRWSALPGGATARAWSRRPTTPRRNVGRARWPTTPRSPRPKPASTGSRSSWTAAAGSVTGRPPRSPSSRRTEELHAVPVVAFPAEFDVARVVTAQALVAFRGNSYSVPPGLAGAQVQVRHRLGADTLRIVTARAATVAIHRRAVDGAGLVIRDEGHVVALEQAVLAGSTSERPCTHKTRRPPSAAAKLRGLPATGPAAHVVIDLSAYAATAARAGGVLRRSPSRPAGRCPWPGRRGARHRPRPRPAATATGC
ncbi:Mu transposase domain-containing protein [Saccharothrix carnea]|uniref:Mu transposase domain-containing protein n=1 Tax=Saccharothrix carnea TaxID=1280637 RepID=UPI003CCB8F6D